MMLDLVPLYDERGNIILYDRFIDGRWIGSRRTLQQSVENFEAPWQITATPAPPSSPARDK
jgi:hypothetical protein